jgi:hypothetical protein
MAALDQELGWLLDQEVFSVDAVPYSWSDVLASAELRGAVAALVAETREALGRDGSALSPEAIREAGAGFRYRKNLLSADELEAWLAGWHLSVADWTGYLRRTVLQEGAASAVDPDELARAVAVDAICTGFLEREARQLALDAALAEGRVPIGQIAASAAAARAALAAGADVEREIGARSLEWTRIDAALLTLADLEAAREAALCVRVDGRSLADVAVDCGVPLESRALYLDEAERDGLTALLGAEAGELVGPVARGESFVLVQVNGRTRPSAEDPELRRRAQAYLVERAGERALETRVRWA